MTDMKRITISFPDEIDEAILGLRKSDEFARCSYDASILARCERMPEKVRKRVVNSHMEINTLCQYLRTLDLSACRALCLLHISNAASNEGHFISRVRQVVPRHVQVIVCQE